MCHCHCQYAPIQCQFLVNITVHLFACIWFNWINIFVCIFKCLAWNIKLHDDAKKEICCAYMLAWCGMALYFFAIYLLLQANVSFILNFISHITIIHSFGCKCVVEFSVFFFVWLICPSSWKSFYDLFCTITVSAKTHVNSICDSMENKMKRILFSKCVRLKRILFSLFWNCRFVNSQVATAADDFGSNTLSIWKNNCRTEISSIVFWFSTYIRYM